MGKVLDKILAAIIAALCLIGTVDGSSAQQQPPGKQPVATRKIDLKVTGAAGHELLDRITFDLLDEAKRTAPSGWGELAADHKGNPREIAMDQFKKTVLDIQYANTKNPAHRLDIIYPFVGEAPHKVIVSFHGGGWQAGNKRSADSAAVMWAAYQGYAVVNVGYRLSGEAKWPAQIHDAKAAIRFLRANAKQYQLDADKIVVWGISAGGHLAEMLGATNDNPKMEDLSLGNPRASSAVQGVVSWYGVSEITSLTNFGAPSGDKLMGYCIKCKEEKAAWSASPIEFVNKNCPPILLVHGTGDRVVPFVQSVKMAKQVNIATGGGQAKLKLFINASHGDAAIKTIENVADNLYFVDAVLFPGGVNPYRSNRYEPVKVSN